MAYILHPALPFGDTADLAPFFRLGFLVTPFFRAVDLDMKVPMFIYLFFLFPRVFNTIVL